MDSLEQAIKELNSMLPTIKKSMDTVQRAAKLEVMKLEDSDSKKELTDILKELSNCTTNEQHAKIMERLNKIKQNGG
jgi:phenylalanyl-tRNA synthetase alpha subunit